MSLTDKQFEDISELLDEVALIDRDGRYIELARAPKLKWEWLRRVRTILDPSMEKIDRFGVTLIRE